MGCQTMNVAVVLPWLDEQAYAQSLLPAIQTFRIEVGCVLGFPRMVATGSAPGSNRGGQLSTFQKLMLPVRRPVKKLR